MGIETRGGRAYYYRKRREGKRVISEYVGGGELGQWAALIDQEQREEWEQAMAEERADREHERQLNRQIDDLGDMIRMLKNASLLAHGYHTHKGTWRRKRD